MSMIGGARQTNTFEEGMSKLLTELAKMKTSPEAMARLESIVKIETTILEELHKPVDNAEAQGLTNVPSPAGAGPGMPPPGMPGLPPGMMAPGGPSAPPIPGLRAEPNMAGMGEDLTRLMGQPPNASP